MVQITSYEWTSRLLNNASAQQLISRLQVMQPFLENDSDLLVFFLAFIFLFLLSG